MALEFDSSHPLKLHVQRVQLVEAVCNARKDDETDWLEWKGGLNLSEPWGIGTLAKQIIAFANRKPSTAAKWMRGYGYIVIGASHGANMPGIQPMDPAVLSDRLKPYLGQDGPVWEAHWLDTTTPKEPGHQVLLLTVDPPVQGDHIHCLHKQFRIQRSDVNWKQFNVADIFIRSGAKSEPVTASQLRMLETRSHHDGPDTPEGPEISLAMVGRIQTYDPARVTAHAVATAALIRQNNEDPETNLFTLANFGPPSADDLDDWERRYQSAIQQTAQWIKCRERLVLTVTNDSPDNYSQLLIKIEVPSDTTLEDKPNNSEPVRIPDCPTVARVFPPASPHFASNQINALARLAAHEIYDYGVPSDPSLYVENDTLIFHIPLLRPNDQIVTDEFTLIVNQPSALQTTLSTSATTTSSSGIFRSQLPVEYNDATKIVLEYIDDPPYIEP